MYSMYSFLDDTRRLYERGDYQAALELVDLWLGEHPDDADARVLKAEICLNSGANFAYVGQVLVDYAADGSAPLADLRRQSAEVAWRLVADGRARLRSRYPDEALAAFDNAAALVPTDAVIPLAAGLALVRIQPARSPSEPFSPFGDVRRQLSPAALTAQIEKYLRRVIADEPGDARIREVAITALARHWLTEGKLTVEALALVASIAAPSPATADLLGDLIEQTRALVCETVANLLRCGLPDQAAGLLKVCAHVPVADARLALYEAERWRDQPAAALAAYERALTQSAAPGEPITAAAAQTMLTAVQSVVVKCPHCGKATRPNAATCTFCETLLATDALLIDAYPGASPMALAQIGLSEMCLRQGDTCRALEHWQAAADLLPPDDAAQRRLRGLHERLTTSSAVLVEAPAERIVRVLAAQGIGAELLLNLRRVNERHADSWTRLPPDDRAGLIRQLIDARELRAAQETLAVAFADQSGLLVAAHLQARLDKTIQQRLAETLVTVREQIAAGRPDEAQALATAALELRRDARLLRARGDARQAAGSDLAALDDYFAAAAAAPAEHDAAYQAAALVLERRWDVAGARALLAALDANAPGVSRALARLARRERGEPVVLTERIGEVVMDDTLTRRIQPPYYHGYFALAVREVGCAGENDDGWIDRLLAAGSEFVQVLGALRDVVGGAIFVLRTIGQPHHQIPERGTITVALLARISVPDEAECRARALQLWADIHAVLPLAQENVYVFEPVVDEDELHALLTPFELAHAAEIVRTEVTIDGGSAFHPFLPGSVDRHSLHWALLRQRAPALISIHLKPAHLLPWERPTSGAVTTGTLSADDHFLAPADDRLSAHLTRVQLWEKIRQAQTQSLSSAAYLLRIYVAGSAGASQLLPEMAAAALFEPLHGGGGGYAIMRAGSPQAFDVIRRNLSALDVESWALAGGQEPRFRYLVSEAEAAQVFRLPIPSVEGVPGMTLLESRPVIPPAGMPAGGVRLGVSVARVKGVPLPITQADDDRRRHLYVVGKTGMGKSTLLLTLILQDIQAGRGVFLLDPHGDLCDDVLARIPAERRDDVILLDPAETERPIGLNILEAETEADRHRVVNELIGLLTRLYDPHNQGIVGPIFQQSVRNAMLAAMALPDGTLIDVYRILADSQYIRRVLPQVKDPLVRSYWEAVAARVDESAGAQWKAEMLPYLLSKFSRFVEDSTLRRMIGQPRTSIDWRGVMDEGRILLVKVAKGRIGQENAQFIGTLALSSVLQAAFQRGEVPAARRREFYLYIDEVQNYTTPLLATMLSEGRKFGVSLTIANQFLHQLDNGIREAVFGNVGSLVAFRVGAQDAPALAPEFFPAFAPADLLNLPQFTACVKLLVDGMAARPFTMRTLPAMLPADAERAAQIRAASRRRYGTDIRDVQQEILRKF